MRNQILHIFRKDVRHHIWEITLSAAMLVIYAWRESRRPNPWAYSVPGDMLLSQVVSPLVLVAWVLLIVRVVQGESLVGDRQFWVTRPYEWKTLLLAKLLFFLVFFNIPLLILQAALLLMAGFSPASYIPGLLFLQLQWFLFLILPALVLATVTATIGQFVLAVLGLLLYLIAITALASFMQGAGVSGAASIPGSLGSAILIVTSVAVILWQFARRRAMHSRFLLVGTAALMLTIILVSPYRFLIERAYPKPLAGQPMPVQLSFDPAPLGSREGGHAEKDKVPIRIPLLVSGIPTGSVAYVFGTMESIQAPGGLRWDSGWHGTYDALLPERQLNQMDLTIDKDFFEQVKSAPVKVHFTFALAPIRARGTIKIVVQRNPFTIPGEGRCSYSPIDPEQISCVFPLKSRLSLLSAKSEELTCPPPEKGTPLPAGMIGYGWVWGFDVGPAQLGINPVQSRYLSVHDWGEVKDRDLRPRVCPGTPLTVFTDWEDLPRFRTEIEIDGIRLADYQLTDRSVDGGGLGIAVP